MATAQNQVLYKGAAPGTFWNQVDARTAGGFRAPASLPQIVSVVVRHIALGLSAASPFLSFSMSFAVAKSYAMDGPGGLASQANPGFVYEIDLSAIQGQGPLTTDPVQLLSSNGAYAHWHNGTETMIVEVATGKLPCSIAPQCGGMSLVPSPSHELITLINSIRDAEILVLNAVPAQAILARHDVY